MNRIRQLIDGELAKGGTDGQVLDAVRPQLTQAEAEEMVLQVLLDMVQDGRQLLDANTNGSTPIVVKRAKPSVIEITKQIERNKNRHVEWKAFDDAWPQAITDQQKYAVLISFPKDHYFRVGTEMISRYDITVPTLKVKIDELKKQARGITKTASNLQEIVKWLEGLGVNTLTEAGDKINKKTVTVP
jgi:hypothetical protein